MSDASQSSSTSGRYALGHSEDELDRLKTQARLLPPVTRRFFEAAGVGQGMRVLDVGCGSGDTSFLLADMVGPSGAVVGVDRAAGAIDAARARGGGHGNVRFLEGDPSNMHFDEPFDAAVGRFVLMFQAQPHEVLRRVAMHVRPGGVVAFHELDYEGIFLGSAIANLRSTTAVELGDDAKIWRRSPHGSQAVCHLHQGGSSRAHGSCNGLERSRQ